MNLEEYISSGIVESYVMGFASDTEMKEFEKMSQDHSAVLAARTKFELELQFEMMQGSVTPPEEVKRKIFMEIGSAKEFLNEGQTKIPAPSQKIYVWKWVAAASFILFLITLLFAISTITRYKTLEAANLALHKEFGSSNKPDPILAIKPFAEKSSVKWTALMDKANPAHCMAHLYWDSTTKETYLLIGNISRNNPNAEFHLRAMRDSISSDLGKFDASNEGEILKMKSLKDAKVFVITIQQKTKYHKPVMEEVVAEGNL
ncbi:MAG: hypothetical protein NVS1B13_24520 [Flavisolibacter sp.]